MGHPYAVMHIGSKLICIDHVHTKCSLNAIHIERAFIQSTSIGGFELEGELHQHMK